MNQDSEYAKLPCFGVGKLRQCAGATSLKTCRTGNSTQRNNARLWAAAFEMGCNTDIYEFDTQPATSGARKFQKQPELRQKINYDFGVLATNPVSGIVYGIGVAPLTPTNTSCDKAVLLPLGTSVQSNTCTGEPIGLVPGDELGQTAGPALWYKLPIFSAEQLGEGLNLALSTCSPCTNYNTWLLLYEGNSCDNLTIIQGIDGDLFSNIAKIANCVSDNPINEGTIAGSVIEFSPEANKQYWVAVTGIVQPLPPASAGQFELFFYEGDRFTNPLPESEQGGLQIFRFDPQTCQPQSVGPRLPCTVGFVYDATFKTATSSPTCADRCGNAQSNDATSAAVVSALDNAAANSLYFFAQNQPNVIEVDSEVYFEGPNQYSLYRYNFATGALDALTNDFFQDFGPGNIEKIDRSVGNGLTFDGANRLWLASKKVSTESFNILFGWQHKLYQVDPETAAVLSDRVIEFVGFPDSFQEDALPPSEESTVGQYGPRINALAYDKCQDTIYAFVQTFLSVDNPPFNTTFGYNGPGRRYLATLDTATATVHFVQEVTIGGQGLAVELLEAPCVAANAVPLNAVAKQISAVSCDAILNLPNFGQCAPQICAVRSANCRRSAASSLPRLLASEEQTERLVELFLPAPQLPTATEQTAVERCCERNSALGYKDVVLATHPKTGVVYGVGREFDSETNTKREFQLFFISPISGEAVHIAKVEFPLSLRASAAIVDAAFSCADGMLVDSNDALLYLSAVEMMNIEDSFDGAVVLLAVSIGTAKSSLVGRPFLFPPEQSGAAIAFDACHRLYLVSKRVDEPNNVMYKLDSGDGTIVEQKALVFGDGFPNFSVTAASPYATAMTFDKCNDCFYLAIVDSTGENRQTFLGKLSLTADKIQFLGETCSDLYGMTGELRIKQKC